MTVIQTIAAPGEGPPLHVHSNDDEFVCVLEGRLRVKLAEAIHEAPAGSFVFIPKGLTHTWQNPGPETARFLFGFTPASVGMERFFERSDELTGDRRLADAFSKFATDAGWRWSGRRWRSPTHLTSDDGTRTRDRLDDREMIAWPGRHIAPASRAPGMSHQEPRIPDRATRAIGKRALEDEHYERTISYPSERPPGRACR
jgi:hypothetical protein